jgi:two-component sensor histidine kinase
MEEALQASEEKHRLLIEQMLDAVALLEVVYDATGKPVDYRFLDVNPAFETATGLRPSTVIGRCVTSTLPGLDPVWCERFGRTAVDGEPLRFEAYAAPLGRHFDVSVFRPRQGQVACAFEDTTGRKRVESALRASIEEKDALLKEVHHRVKNNLQIVTSLMHLQSMRLEAGREADAFRSTEDRVRSMALLHDTLYRSGNLAHADLRAYLNGLCAQLVHSFGLESGRIRVECRVDPMPLDLDRALPCGLIVSELVSNALRHAFPGGRSGRVAVTMSRETEERAMIEVSDDGVGLSPGFDPAAASTLGMQLILGLSAQLGGEAHFSVERPFKCRIDFPVPRESTGNEPGRVASGSSH